MRRVAIRRRPDWLPFSWRRLTPPGGFDSHAQKRDWQLVLDSQKIDFIILRARGREHIYVSPLVERMARHELAEYARENSTAPKRRTIWPLHNRYYLSCLLLLPLIWIYGQQTGRFPPISWLPPPSQWEALGSLNGTQILLHAQWQRLATALTLHTGIVHLTGNLVFALLFLSLLGRLVGAGRAMLLSLLAGISGNFLSLLIHGINYGSIGFSTALFGCVGVMAGIELMRSDKKLLMPAAFALAVLAIMGTEGKNTDLIAHLCGLTAGMGIGVFENFRVSKGWPGLSQWQAGAACILIIGGAWIMAFQESL